MKHILGIQTLQIPQIELQNHILFELEILFGKNCTSLSHYKLPLPTRLIFDDLNSRLVAEELDYNIEELLEEHIELFSNLNNEQKNVYNAVLVLYMEILEILYLFTVMVEHAKYIFGKPLFQNCVPREK